MDLSYLSNLFGEKKGLLSYQISLGEMNARYDFTANGAVLSKSLFLKTRRVDFIYVKEAAQNLESTRDVKEAVVNGPQLLSATLELSAQQILKYE